MQAASSPLVRFGLAFLLVYFCLFDTLHWLPPWQSLVVALSSQLFRVTPTTMPGDGSDTIFDYVELPFLAALALLAGLALAWRGPQAATLHELLRLVLRYRLAFAMLVGGLGLVVGQQYPFPDFDVLTSTYDSVPPAVMLSVMLGYSRAYGVFWGSVWVLGAGLLLWRRTTTLGALLLAGVLANTVTLNFCYDAPSKLLSCHLLLMSGILLVPDLRRLGRALVLNRPLAPADLRSRLATRWPRLAVAAKAVAVLVLVLVPVANEVARAKPPDDPMSGVYEVSGAPYYRLLVSRTGGVCALDLANDNRVSYRWQLDGDALTIGEAACKLTPVGEDQWRLDGDWLGSPYHANLRKWRPEHYALQNHGFHWITERADP